MTSPKTAVRRVMEVGLILAVVSLLPGTLLAKASPFDDLASPSPEIRKHAAEVIQQNHLYSPTPKEPWEKFVASIKPGDSANDFLTQLASVSANSFPLKPRDLPPQCVFTAPLDESWAVRCVFFDSQIVHCELVAQAKVVEVSPPPGFTGCWRTYHIDGTPLLCWYDTGHWISPPGDYGEAHHPLQNPPIEGMVK